MNSLFISLCMIVKNESQNLARCLGSIQDKVDEIIIIDTGSTDNTKEIALSYAAKVYDYKWNDDFASARNYANSKASGEWIIFLDADEELVIQQDLISYLEQKSSSIICHTLYRYNYSASSNTMIEEGFYFRIFRNLPNICFKSRLHEQLFLDDRPLTKNEVLSINKDTAFIKHYGDSDGKALKKCVEFYIPMLERISQQENLSLMLLNYLSDYYKNIGETQKSIACYEQAMEMLMPYFLTGDKPSDFIWAPTWLSLLIRYFLDKKDFETLLLIIPNALRWCSSYLPILNLTGIVLGELGFDLAAAGYFQDCLDRITSSSHHSSALFEPFNPSIPNLAIESLYNQSYAYTNLKQWDKAITALEKCLELDSSLTYIALRLEELKKIKAVDNSFAINLEQENATISNNTNSGVNFYYYPNQISDSEINIIQQFVSSGNIVFDVGANVGNWSSQVLAMHPNVQIHLFEAIPQTYYTLLQNLSKHLKQGNIFINNIALSKSAEVREYFFYDRESALSTMYRRISVEEQLNLLVPRNLLLPTIPLDQYCQQRNIHHINFLKIDVKGAEFDILLGAQRLLKIGSIDIIQFEYGGTYQDANVTLEQVYKLLEKNNYFIFKITIEELEFIPFFSSEYEDYQYSNFLAINERICPLLMGEEPKMLDIQDICFKYQIYPRGVVHIGAHEGQEIDDYIAMNIQKMLLIEANPEVYLRLEDKISNYSNSQIKSVNCAISNYTGEAILRVTSFDQSSSLLPLKLHTQLYPQITEEKQIQVPCKTLDDLLQEIQLDISQYNLLNIDIQGAELMALQGANQSLQFIDAINIEVNYEELYEGCVLAHELDEFLANYGFERVATISPYHRSWGDAVYIKKPLITMTTLGSNGRFANQLFQYAFLKIYAEKYNLRVATSPWIGNYLFGHSDPLPIWQLPIVQDLDNSYEALAESILNGSQALHTNVDFFGYFQYHTKYYAPYKSLFRSLFQPIHEISLQMELALAKLRSFGKTIVAIHLRRGDYGYGIFFTAPTQWYKDWLDGFWDTLEDPILFIASDEIDNVIDDFIEYMPITSRDLELEGLDSVLASFYPDFYLLSNSDVVAISNSSYSFVACMLNEVGRFFFRPHLPTQKLIAFDPWNSDVLFKDKIEEQT